ncbi:MAG: dihydroorotase family protein [Sphaerobacter sp.]|nr:dihydroorotase family protein [Sphaerobacter sp.]
MLLPDGLQSVDIGIANGRIVALLAPGSEVEAREIIDAGGLLVFPGTIDAHFHCRAPSYPEREDFASGTAAAAVSGVTTVLEMPISIPPSSTPERLVERMKLASTSLYVDMGFYGSCGTLDAGDIAGQIEAGAIGIKGFLQSVPAGREDEFDGICLATDVEILRAFELLRGSPVPCVFHAEANDLLTYLTDRLIAAGRRDPQVHPLSRPPFVEAVAVAKLLVLAEEFDVPLHIPHVSSKVTVDLIRDAKARGVRVTAETCPQYLAFDASAFDRVGLYAKCNPPLKTPEDRAGLWEGVLDGTLDIITTDHSPFTTEEKDRTEGNIWATLPGFPGVEVLTQFVMGRAVTRELSFERATELISAGPARIFGLGTKGRIAIGYDADLVLYDPEPEIICRPENFKSRSGGAGRIWEGMVLRGRTVTTLVRGQVVARDGDVVGEPGTGRVIRPSAAPCAGTAS